MTDFVSTLASTVIFLFEEGGQLPIGTAFIVGYPVADGSGAVVPLVVTAKHVLGDREKVVGSFSPKSGSERFGVEYDLARLRAQGDLWEHPDEGVDLMVFRIHYFEQTRCEPIPLKVIASSQTYSEEDIKATDRVIFPCLLVSFMGAALDYPVVRDGSIALIPEEPVPLTYYVGARLIRTRQKVVLMDATSILGASGSPIFLWPGPRVKHGAYTFGKSVPWLLGIMHGFYPAIPRPLVGIQNTREGPTFAENSGIAIVFPSWRLLEILELEELARRLEELLESQN